MGIKPFKKIEISDVPGPGAYHKDKVDSIASKSTKAPSFSFGKDSRVKEKEEQDPVGPGLYNQD